jgi:EthD domain
MVKLVLLLKRRAGMSVEDFRKYYETTHSVLGKKILPSAIRYQRRYLQALGAAPGYEAVGETYDCITEVWFADHAAMEAALVAAAAPDAAALLAEDEAKLFDRSKIRFYLVEEECPSFA